MMVLTATLLSLIGCLMLYKARSANALAGQTRLITKAGAWICLAASLAVFLMSYSAVKASFIWLAVVSMTGGIIVLAAGTRAREASR